MRLTTQGRYAVRAMVDLALHSDSKPVSLKRISERQAISEKYLEQLFRKLRKAGLIQGVRGVQGGYLLGKRPQSINLGEILRSVGECLTPVHCIDGVCTRQSECAPRLFWRELDRKISTFLDSVTLSDLCKEARKGGSDE